MLHERDRRSTEPRVSQINEGQAHYSLPLIHRHTDASVPIGVGPTPYDAPNADSMMSSYGRSQWGEAHQEVEGRERSGRAKKAKARKQTARPYPIPPPLVRPATERRDIARPSQTTSVISWLRYTYSNATLGLYERHELPANAGVLFWPRYWAPTCPLDGVSCGTKGRCSNWPESCAIRGGS